MVFCSSGKNFFTVAADELSDNKTQQNTNRTLVKSDVLFILNPLNKIIDPTKGRNYAFLFNLMSNK